MSQSQQHHQNEASWAWIRNFMGPAWTLYLHFRGSQASTLCLRQLGPLRCIEMHAGGLSQFPVLGNWSGEWIILASLHVISFSESCKESGWLKLLIQAETPQNIVFLKCWCLCVLCIFPSSKFPSHYFSLQRKEILSSQHLLLKWKLICPNSWCHLEPTVIDSVRWDLILIQEI